MADVKAHHPMTADIEARWLEFFGLRRRPFIAVPSPEHYCPMEPMESARQNLFRMIRRGEGAGLIAGPPGTGKTLLCRLLAREFKEEYAVVFLAGGRLDSPKALCQAILYQLGLSFFGLDEGELRIAVEAYFRGDELPEFLTRSPRAVLPLRPVLLLVDEAHSLPLRILEDIRTLTNIFQDDVPRVHLVLSGGMLLEDRLSSPRLEPLAQRIVVRSYLQPLTRPQTEAFICHQISLAGGDPDRIFLSEARDALFRATGGVPRLVNQVADHAMFLAFVAGKSCVDWPLVEEAWADLQQLPGPWNDSQRRQRPDIIEFGQLVDDRKTFTEEASGCTIPFLRVARPEATGDSGVFETLEKAEQAVAELIAENHREATQGPHPDNGIFVGQSTSEASPKEVLLTVDETGWAIAIEIPTPPNPFEEPFDTEAEVNNWHVDYICRQDWASFEHFSAYGYRGRYCRWSTARQLWQKMVAEDSDAFVSPTSDAGGWYRLSWVPVISTQLPWRNDPWQKERNQEERLWNREESSVNDWGHVVLTSDCGGTTPSSGIASSVLSVVSSEAIQQPADDRSAQLVVCNEYVHPNFWEATEYQNRQQKVVPPPVCFQLPRCEIADDPSPSPRPPLTVRRVRRDKRSLTC